MYASTALFEMPEESDHRTLRRIFWFLTVFGNEAAVMPYRDPTATVHLMLF